MKKYFFALVALLALAVTSVNAKQVTYRMDAYGLDLEDDNSVTDYNGITITCNSGYMSSNFWDAEFTISTDDGREIKEIHVESYTLYSGCDDAGWLWVGGYGACWAGSATSVSGNLTIENIGEIAVTVEEPEGYVHMVADEGEELE